MEKREARFAWMAEQMPITGQLVAGYRSKYGDAHVNECIRHGLRGEPGYFFAREGALAVGVPATGWTLPQWMEAYMRTATVVWVRPPEVDSGKD